MDVRGRCVGLFLMALAVAVPAAADPAVDKVMDCMRGNVPPTLREDLSAKPRCQYDYSYKMGLTLAYRLAL